MDAGGVERRRKEKNTFCFLTTLASDESEGREKWKCAEETEKQHDSCFGCAQSNISRG